MKKYVLAFITLQAVIANCQELSLKDCLIAVETNYPLVKQKKLEDEINAIAVSINNTAYLPQANFLGQGSYQSDVTSLNLPLPGVSLETLEKDQYKAYFDVNQSIYDGGVTRLKNDLQAIAMNIGKLDIDRQLREIRLQVQRYFFNALLAHQNIDVLKVGLEDIDLRLKVLETGFKYGTVKQSQIDILRVDRLKIEQQISEQLTLKEASVKIVALLTGLSISPKTIIITPEEPSVIGNDFTNRPEWKIFEFQEKQIAANTSLENASILPRLSLFGQGGYARPALNLLSNDFDWYYIVGARVTWDVSSLYRYTKNKKVSNFETQSVAVQRECLEKQLNSQKVSLDSDIIKYRELISKDLEIISLQEKIVKVAATELNNGIINATDYLIEKNEELTARQSLNKHRVQQLSAQYELLHLTGN